MNSFVYNMKIKVRSGQIKKWKKKNKNEKKQTNAPNPGVRRNGICVHALTWRIAGNKTKKTGANHDAMVNVWRIYDMWIHEQKFSWLFA